MTHRWLAAQYKLGNGFESRGHFVRALIGEKALAKDWTRANAP